MKMLPEHFAEIKRRCAEFDTEDRRALYRASGLTAMRYRWDVASIAFADLPGGWSKWVCDNPYSYLNDTHIDTALRKVFGMDGRSTIPLLIPTLPAAPKAVEPKKVYSGPKFCPYCGGSEIDTDLVLWKAVSLEDPHNECAVSEHQCRACEGRSFWG
jgi:hypothetical protein